MSLHGWIQGCPCHPINSREDTRPANCPFQGLNCKGFSARLEQVISEYEQLRIDLAAEQFGDVCMQELQDIIGFIIAMITLKLKRWVDDLPYLIWQVGKMISLNLLRESFTDRC